jgi:hypothetical protein
MSLETFQDRRRRSDQRKRRVQFVPFELSTLAILTAYCRYGSGNLETGRKQPTADTARRLDEVLAAGGQLAALVTVPAGAGPVSAGDELDAWELARRVDASDVSTGTLERLEQVVDDLPVRPGAGGAVRRHPPTRFQVDVKAAVAHKIPLCPKCFDNVRTAARP